MYKFAFVEPLYWASSVNQSFRLHSGFLLARCRSHHLNLMPKFLFIVNQLGSKLG